MAQYIHHLANESEADGALVLPDSPSPNPPAPLLSVHICWCSTARVLKTTKTTNYEKETSRNKELRSGNRDDRNLLHRSTSLKGKPADFLSFHPARLLTIKFTGSYPGIYKK